MKRLALSLALPALLLCFVALEAHTAVAQSQQLQITNGPVVEAVGNNWAVVSWTTNAGGSSIIRYGTDPNNLGQTAQAPYSNGTTSQNHRVRINNLQPNTTYYFTADSGQGQGTGTMATSPVQTFHTNTNGTATSNYPGSNSYQQQGYYPSSQGYSPGQNSQAVAITYGPQATDVTPNSAVITWTTNAGSSSIVRYGTAPNALYQTAQAPYTNTGTGQPQQHTVQINNLQPNTTYYFFVDSGQASGTGTGTSSQIMQFRTAA